MSRVFAGARIRAMRKERALTQVEMARKLGFSTSYLNQLENDHRPLTVTTLMRLTSVFDVPAEYFSGERASRTATALQQSLSDALGRTPALGELSDFATRFPDLAQDMLTMSRLASARSAAPEPGGPRRRRNPPLPRMSWSGTSSTPTPTTSTPSTGKPRRCPSACPCPAANGPTRSGASSNPSTASRSPGRPSPTTRATGTCCRAACTTPPPGTCACGAI
ncbi:helix-turn-helix domain-containing protein [Corynebacterium hansenii]|uniref:Helix-turn-helix domain-containing protein n=1 Tax=Corynebacterium hansenii TaxID=394964 RepID=A0ABV7ZR05_9CORY|nr:helix-turn-helix transcriptional regulator [Corynebacterium hansenii]